MAITDVVWVAYATSTQQWLLKVNYEVGMTAIQAIEQSGLAEQTTIPEPLHVGIFGHKLKSPEQHVLQAGDRVEVYRPLTINPLDIRRNRAKEHPVGRFGKGNRFK